MNMIASKALGGSHIVTQYGTPNTKINGNDLESSCRTSGVTQMGPSPEMHFRAKFFLQNLLEMI